MLSELKLKVKKQKPEEQVDYINYNQLACLGEFLNDDRETEFYYRDKTVKIRGIPEDFRVFLDEKLVCECVYENVHHINKELAKELLT